MASVLGIPLYDKPVVEACTQITSTVLSNARRENHCVSATGAHGLVFAQRNASFRKSLEEFYLHLPDGMPGVWVGRLKGAKQMRRCYGPDFFEAMMIGSAEKDIKHFFCGGVDGVAKQLKYVVERKFGNRNIVGFLCPPFLAVEDYDYEEIVLRINATNADIVWIGLSTPKQEIFAHRLSKRTNVSFIICVGAAFDFHMTVFAKLPHLSK